LLAAHKLSVARALALHLVRFLVAQSLVTFVAQLLVQPSAALVVRLSVMPMNLAIATTATNMVVVTQIVAANQQQQKELKKPRENGAFLMSAMK
jgi:hypothetical protein